MIEWIIRVSLVFLLALCVIACKPLTPPLEEIAKATKSTVSGYNFLPMPRSSIPIGASWIQHTGPNGIGVNAENLITVNSVSTIHFTDVENTSLKIRFARFIGLSAGQLKFMNIEINGLQITRVNDLFKLNISPGSHILYEGVSAKTIQLSFTKGAGAGVEATLKSRKIPITGSVEEAGQKTITIDGSDLFFAYRVVTFEYLDFDRQNILVDGDTKNMSLFVPGVMKTVVNSKSLHDCICSDDSSFSIDSCIEDVPIKINMIVKTLISGVPATKNFDYKIGVDRNYYVNLGVIQENELVQGSAFSVKGMLLDIPKPDYQFGEEIKGRNCRVTFPPGGKAGQVLIQSFELKPLANPLATGWSGG